jgi:hypothetical protein
VTRLLRIDRAGQAPVFVSYVHLDGRISTTFHQAEARRFRSASPDALRKVAKAAAAWPAPGSPVFVAAPA